MAVIKHHKYVASLPGTLEANSIYYVRAGAGFDIYVTNSSGTIVAYPLNRSIDVWEFMPLGMKFPIDTHTTGVPVPPTDNPNYRYIKLTASDSYNTGVLTSESVSGSAPLVQATAVINDAGSPMNGQTVRLINTERRFLRPGSSGTVEADALQGHWFGDADQVATYPYMVQINQRVGTSPVSNINTLATSSTNQDVTSAGQLARVNIVGDGVNGSPRVDSETRVKSLGADYFMRIR